MGTCSSSCFSFLHPGWPCDCRFRLPAIKRNRGRPGLPHSQNVPRVRDDRRAGLQSRAPGFFQKLLVISQKETTEMITTRHAIPINPKLPAKFDCTANEQRPPSHRRWWNRPYIETYTWEEGHSCPREKWFASWPSGTRYDVRCLDGGAWDRPTCWGMFKTLEEAIACARSGSSLTAKS